jgi:hypothetical protein
MLQGRLHPTSQGRFLILLVPQAELALGPRVQLAGLFLRLPELVARIFLTEKFLLESGRTQSRQANTLPPLPILPPFSEALAPGELLLTRFARQLLHWENFLELEGLLP